MRTNRRSFLGLLGVGTVSAPLAAKAAAEQEIASLTALAGQCGPALASGSGLSIDSMPANNDGYIKMAEYLRIFGKLPEHIERDVRDRSRYVSVLDPDIACKKSWSLCVKIAAQRERNYANEIERYQKMGWYEQTAQSFTKKMGFRWLW